MNWRLTTARIILTGLMVLGLIFMTIGCSDRLEVQPENELVETVALTPQPKLVEVSPPEGIQKLRQAFDRYQPQVRILHPQPDEVVQDRTVRVQLEVRGLPIFQNSQLGLGPHLELILDNQSAIKFYDLNQPLVLKDLLPGTHTIRVFAVRPWDESYKNQGAYAQTTFHIYTTTEENHPDPRQPLLTYNLPKGVYGAEPIMLDFYLSNAPLHLVAQENPDDNIVDWRIRVTVNGSSFVVDRWEPIYLKGFEPGRNWVKLEFLDEQGNSVNNVFNNTARLLTYESRGQDSLAKLIRGELTSDQVLGLVNPNYEIPTAETAQPEVEVTPEDIPAEIPEPVISEPIADQESPDQILNDEEAIEEEIEETIPEEIPAGEVTPEAIPAEIPEAVTSEPMSERVSEEGIPEAIEEEIPEESPATEPVTPEEVFEQIVPEESEPVTSEKTVEKTVPEETEAVLPVTTSQPEEQQEMPKTVAPVETPEAVISKEATTSTTETTEATEAEKANIREVVDRVLDRVFDFINYVNIPWFGGETPAPTPAAVD